MLEELERLSNVIASYRPGEDQKPLVLCIRKLKRFILDDAKEITIWVYDTLKSRKSMAAQMTDPLDQALLDLIKDIILFEKAVNCIDSLDTLFKHVQVESTSMVWLLCLVGEKLPQIVTRRIHQLFILGNVSYNNPYLGTSASATDHSQKNLVYISNCLFIHLLNGHKQIVIDSVVELFQDYLGWIEHNQPLTTDLQKFTLSYLLFLPKTSAMLFKESWSILFRLLCDHGVAGTIFLYEKTYQSSLIKIDDKLQTIASIFPRWLKSVAFEQNGLFMKHAMDVAIMLDTLIHDSRLDLKHLVPTGGRSMIDTLKPSFEQLDLKPSSIDLVGWTMTLFSSDKRPSRGTHDLQIPLFLLQLDFFNDTKKEEAIQMFVQLITRVDQPIDEASADGIRYFILDLVSSAEAKWPDLFQFVLEQIFSKAIAMHIADNEGSVNIEKILGNLAMLFAPFEGDKPGFDAFQKYMVNHWRQVSLLFLNHPSIQCRAMGYRVLTHSRFWQHIATEEFTTVSKLLMDAWFRHIKGRYLRVNLEEELCVIEEQQKLISCCCQNTELAKTMLCFTMDCILGGALEIFPSMDTVSIQQERQSLLDQVTQHDYLPPPMPTSKPPQFITCLSWTQDIRDCVYTDNIARTASLFNGLSTDINHHVLSHLLRLWQPISVSFNTYHDVLPMNIPYQNDIMIGGAFKDHPVLFLILEKYSMAQTRDMVRSILVYFIVFWHMKEVVNVPTTLSFATQLEETIRLVAFMKPILPEFLVNTHPLFPFMSAKDLGDILFRMIWDYLSWQSAQHIPGITQHMSPQDQEARMDKYRKTMLAMCQQRLVVLEKAPQWHQALSKAMSTLFQ